MDLKIEERDYEHEEPRTAGARTTGIVLSDMEELGMGRRFCRTLKYEPRSVPGSNEMDRKDEKVSVHIGDPIIKDAIEVSDEKSVCKDGDVETSSRAKLKLHAENHQICGPGIRIRTRLTENGCDAQTFSNQFSYNAKTDKYICNLCGMEYTHKGNLHRHMRLHTGETPHTCEVCGRGFRRSDWLMKHMSLHQEKPQTSRKGRRTYNCDHCVKKYKSRDGLINHLRTHSGERAFSCAICEKQFFNPGCLRTHLSCHSDDRPFTCSECGHSFKRAGTLDKHKRIHTGEKPYSCKICGKKFRYKYSVSLHLKSRCCRHP